MPTRKLTHERVIPKRYSSLGVCRGADGGRIATPPVKRLLWLLSLRKKKVTINLKECNFSFMLVFKKITFSLKNYRDIVSKKMYLFFFFSYFLGAKKVLQRRHKRRWEFRFSPLLLTPPPLQTAKGVPPLESPFRALIYI